MGTGDGGTVLMLFALAVVLVLYWRVVLAVALIGTVWTLLLGAVQVAQWFQAQS